MNAKYADVIWGLNRQACDGQFGCMIKHNHIFFWSSIPYHTPFYGHRSPNQDETRAGNLVVFWLESLSGILCICAFCEYFYIFVHIFVFVCHIAFFCALFFALSTIYASCSLFQKWFCLLEFITRYFFCVFPFVFFSWRLYPRARIVLIFRDHAKTHYNAM